MSIQRLASVVGVHPDIVELEQQGEAFVVKIPIGFTNHSDMHSHVYNLHAVDVQAEVKNSLYTVHGIPEVFFGNLPEDGSRCIPREYSCLNLLLENPCCNDLGEP